MLYKSEINYTFIILLAFLFTFSESSFGQNTAGVINGRIVDGQTGEPIVQATVVIKGLTKGVCTDLEGNYTLKNVPPGIQKVECRYLGYKGRIIEVFVKSGEIARCNFLLEEESSLGPYDPNHKLFFPAGVHSCNESKTISVKMYKDSPDGTFVLNWDDISSTGCEYYCLVTDSSGIIGEYHGLSTPMSFCTFKTSGSHITLHFKTGQIMPGNPPNDLSKCRCTFKEVTVPVIDHSEKTIQLNPDSETKYYQFKANAGFYTPFSKKLYYLNSKTGKVRPGKYWLAKMNENDFLISSFIVINPLKEYYSVKGKKYKGAELIRKKELSQLEFDFKKDIYDGFDFWNY